MFHCDRFDIVIFDKATIENIIHILLLSIKIIQKVYYEARKN